MDTVRQYTDPNGCPNVCNTVGVKIKKTFPISSLPRLQRVCHAEFTAERKRNGTIVNGKRKETERNLTPTVYR